MYSIACIVLFVKSLTLIVYKFFYNYMLSKVKSNKAVYIVIKKQTLGVSPV